MPVSFKGRVVGIYALITLLNVLAWSWALASFQDYPVLLGTALLAYGLGLRHAVDPDHIAAIDNVTRTLMQAGQRPAGVGLFFSLGHSTVVMAASVAIALTATVIHEDFPGFREVGGLIGTSVSALFLFLIAAVNLMVLAGLWRTFRRVRAGGAYREEDLDLLLAQRGVIGRVFRRLFRLIRASWHMYPLGLLFGLGFDTATEIGLLGISATEAAKGLPVWSILVFPALFTAAMTLVDTTDSVLMLGAYGWAFRKPMRKLFYNLTITFVSVLVAVIVGGMEVLMLAADKLGLQGGLWDAVADLGANFGNLGYLIVGIFLTCWTASVLIYKLKRYDEVEVRV